MDILSKVKRLLKKDLTLKSFAIIFGGCLCLLIGFGAKHITNKNDSVPEQVSEYVLDEFFDIKIDFSPDDEPKKDGEAKND